MSVARLYAHVNESQPQEYWDYEAFEVPWQVGGPAAAARGMLWAQQAASCPVCCTTSTACTPSDGYRCLQ